MQSKTTSQSKVTMSTVMLPQHTNPSGNVHGGEIMKLMDTAASVVARRHTRGNVVTARVDEMEFHHPIRIGNVVTCYGRLTFTGRSSMEIAITVKVEDLSCEQPETTALTAFFTFVSLGADGRPQPVPPLEVVTEEEKCLFRQGQQRYISYKEKAKLPRC